MGMQARATNRLIGSGVVGLLALTMAAPQPHRVASAPAARPPDVGVATPPAAEGTLDRARPDDGSPSPADTPAGVGEATGGEAASAGSPGRGATAEPVRTRPDEEPVYEQTMITSFDGTRLAARVWRPARIDADTPGPVLLKVTPYGNGDQPAESPIVVEAAWARGWSYAEVNLRGYGDSEGCSDLLGPDDQGDTVAAAEWASQQPWSDGRVVMTGLSYDGWSVLAAAAHGAPVVAGAARSAVVSHHEVTYDDGVPRGNAGIWVEGHPVLEGGSRTTVPLVAYRFGLAFPPADPVAFPGCLAEDVQGVATGGEPSAEYARERDLSPLLADADVPMLFHAGFQDQNVQAEELGGWTYYGGPKAATFGHTTHRSPHRKGVYRDIVAWLGAHLDEQPLDRPAVMVEDNTGHWRTEPAYPPTDVVGFDLPVRPGEVVDHADQGAFHVDADRMALTATRPFRTRTRLAGQVDVQIDHGTPLTVAVPENGLAPRVIALVYDVAPDGTADLVSRGAALLDAGGTTTLDTHFTDWVVEPGHRLMLALAGTDVTAYERYSGQFGTSTYQVTGGTWTLPTVTAARRPDLDRSLPAPFAPMERVTIDRRVVASRQVGAELPPRCPGCRARGGRPSRPLDTLLDTELELGPAGKVTPQGPPPVTEVLVTVPEGSGPVYLHVVAEPSQPADLTLRVRHVERDASAGIGIGTGRSIESVVVAQVHDAGHDGSVLPGTYAIELVNQHGPATSLRLSAQLFRAPSP